MPDKPPFVPNNATPRTVRLSSWDRAVVVATVLAYRRSMGEQNRATVADKAAPAAFIAAGGDPQLAAEDVPAIIAAAPRNTATGFGDRPASGWSVRNGVEGEGDLAAAEGLLWRPGRRLVVKTRRMVPATAAVRIVRFGMDEADPSVAIAGSNPWKAIAAPPHALQAA